MPDHDAIRAALEGLDNKLGMLDPDVQDFVCAVRELLEENERLAREVQTARTSAHIRKCADNLKNRTEAQAILSYCPKDSLPIWKARAEDAEAEVVRLRGRFAN